MTKRKENLTKGSKSTVFVHNGVLPWKSCRPFRIDETEESNLVGGRVRIRNLGVTHLLLTFYCKLFISRHYSNHDGSDNVCLNSLCSWIVPPLLVPTNFSLTTPKLTPKGLVWPVHTERLEVDIYGPEIISYPRPGSLESDRTTYLLGYICIRGSLLLTSFLLNFNGPFTTGWHPCVTVIETRKRRLVT